MKAAFSQRSCLWRLGCCLSLVAATRHSAPSSIAFISTRFCLHHTQFKSLAASANTMTSNTTLSSTPILDTQSTNNVTVDIIIAPPDNGLSAPIVAEETSPSIEALSSSSLSEEFPSEAIVIDVPETTAQVTPPSLAVEQSQVSTNTTVAASLEEMPSQDIAVTSTLPFDTSSSIATPTYLSQQNYQQPWTDGSSKIDALMKKYKGRVVLCSTSVNPSCDVILCGTLHVATSSTIMVKEAISELCPEYVLVEVCESRIDNLVENTDQHNITLRDVMRLSIEQRSFMQFGMGLLSWMQCKAAIGMGSKLGGELAAATKTGLQIGSKIILGDRLYMVTIQRVFDKLGFFEKLRNYMKKSEEDDAFVEREIAKFHKYLPSVADIIISERDEYLAQSIIETARIGFKPSEFGPQKRGRIVAVVGAGHLLGIQKWLALGGVPSERLLLISSSSKHPPSWPGFGVVSLVNGTALYPDL